MNAQPTALKLKAVAQDGMRVRANAGAASFRRKGRLEDYLDVAREREQRVEAALTRLPELEAITSRRP